MAKIFPGRFTAQCDEAFVVFFIGMRVNRIFDLRWLRVARAMPPMLAELKRTPDLGLLHFEPFLYWRGVGILQYWRSFEHLHAYAHARNAKHLPAWAEFNRRIGAMGPSESGMRPISWPEDSSRPSTPTCRNLAWPVRQNTWESPVASTALAPASANRNDGA